MPSLTHSAQHACRVAPKAPCPDYQVDLCLGLEICCMACPYQALCPNYVTNPDCPSSGDCPQKGLETRNPGSCAAGNRPEQAPAIDVSSGVESAKGIMNTEKST